MHKKKSIGMLLVEYGFITEADLNEALHLQTEQGGKLGEILVSGGKVSNEDVEWILSKQLNIPFVIVDETVVNADLLTHFKKDFLMTNRIVPMYETDDEVAIATDDPFNKEAFDAIEEKLNKRVTISAGNGEAIDDLLQKIFKLEGAPELIAEFEAIKSRLEGTSYYRLDFIISEQNFIINAYGCGALKKVYSAEKLFTQNDIFNAFAAMEIGFIYEEFNNTNQTLLSIYPMIETLEPSAYPVVLGQFGLARPSEITFTDLKVFNVNGLFQSDVPIDGYDYITAHPRKANHEKTIYTLDSVADGFVNYHIKAAIPTGCPGCSGGGCDQCNFIGSKHTELDGIYSYSDLIKMMREG